MQCNAKTDFSLIDNTNKTDIGNNIIKLNYFLPGPNKEVTGEQVQR